MRHFARILFVRPGMEFLAVKQMAGDREVWNLPGGKIEPNELPLRAALREALEEISLRGRRRTIRKLTRRKIVFGNEPWVGHFFVAFGSFAAPVIREPDKILEVQWVNLEEAQRLPAYHAAFSQIFAFACDKFDIVVDWGSGLKCLQPPKSWSPPEEDSSQTLPRSS